MSKISIIFMILWVSSLVAKSTLPKTFIDKGACPFECCTYRNWTSHEEVKLVKNPNGVEIIGSVKKNEMVKALTGEVHVTPTPMDIVFAHHQFKVGDRVYLLTYQGEGFQKVWFNGNITSEEVIFIHYEGNEDKGCLKPSAQCWGRLSGKQKSDWWVKIQLKDGKSGWTKEADKFDNKDSCG